MTRAGRPPPWKRATRICPVILKSSKVGSFGTEDCAADMASMCRTLGEKLQRLRDLMEEVSKLRVEKKTWEKRFLTQEVKRVAEMVREAFQRRRKVR